MTDSGLVQLRQKIAQAELGLAVQELASHKKDAEVASLRSQLAARLWEQTQGENKAKLLQKQQLEHLRAELFAERAAISALNLGARNCCLLLCEHVAQLCALCSP